MITSTPVEQYLAAKEAYLAAREAYNSQADTEGYPLAAALDEAAENLRDALVAIGAAPRELNQIILGIGSGEVR